MSNLWWYPRLIERLWGKHYIQRYYNTLGHDFPQSEQKLKTDSLYVYNISTRIIIIDFSNFHIYPWLKGVNINILKMLQVQVRLPCSKNHFNTKSFKVFNKGWKWLSFCPAHRAIPCPQRSIKCLLAIEYPNPCAQPCVWLIKKGQSYKVVCFFTVCINKNL